ncbi:hypothetical protein ACTJIL_13200 [Luteimonas sp. 22616]
MNLIPLFFDGGRGDRRLDHATLVSLIVIPAAVTVIDDVGE